MFDRFIKQTVQNQMNADANSSFAMSGNLLEDSFVVPDVDHSLPAEEKAEIILQQMTLEEKVNMLGGEDNLAVKATERLKLPKVWSSDASAGVRCFQRATAFPVPVAMTATWNRSLLEQTGEIIARECRAKGISILLGPGINIYRVPTCGRNFEYMGEDPFLASELVVPYIKGVQRLGVITTVKHFACNNSDYDRHRMNSKVDERTLQEIYFPAFKAAVQKAGSKSVMSSYNPVNGEWASENHDLLTRVLREEWGFDGFVISDWISLYSTEGPLKAGLDLEMPKADFLTLKRIRKLMNKGRLTEADVDKPVRNLLKTFFEMGIYNRPLKDHQYQEYCEEHSQVSLETAREAIVLLKNENNLLPLNRETVTKIAVVGKMAMETTTCGGGSCSIKSHEPISILNGIQAEAGNDIKITYIEADQDNLTVDEQNSIKAADVAVVSVGFTALDESECYDKSWELPYEQNRLIKEVAALNAKIVVTLTTGSGIETESWLSEVPALMHCFFLGENGGKAVAEILFGSVNPSGKMPFTMAKKWNDFKAVQFYVDNQDRISALRVIGPQGKPRFRRIRDMEYGEKLMVGYRHFDTNKITPQFPFGFGLSYTSFEISALSLSNPSMSVSNLAGGETITASITVANRGERAGSEVVQLYIQDTVSSLPRPEKELKGFAKVHLQPGESKEINLSLDFESFAFFDDTKGKWTAEPGDFIIMIGNSSRNIVEKASLILE